MTVLLAGGGGEGSRKMVKIKNIGYAFLNVSKKKASKRSGQTLDKLFSPQTFLNTIFGHCKKV